VRRRVRAVPQQRLLDDAAVVQEMFSDGLDPADLETGDELLFVRGGLQHNVLRKLRRGQYSIGAELDLHGFTAADARQALALFLIVFVWTPPHFWALAIARRDEYAAARVPMLPVTHGVAHTKRRILGYAVVLLPVSLSPTLFGISGRLYLGGALLLGIGFVARAYRLLRDDSDRAAMRLFGYSITYLTALFALLLVDHFVRF